MHQLFNEEFCILICLRKITINYMRLKPNLIIIIIMHERVQYEMYQRGTATQLSGNSSKVAKKIQYKL